MPTLNHVMQVHRKRTNRWILILSLVSSVALPSLIKRSRNLSKSNAVYTPQATALRKLTALIRILFPSISAKESWILLLFSSFLVLRTLISVYVAKLDGRLVSALIKGQKKKFIDHIITWLLIAVPATYTNSMLGFLQSKLALAFRSRLTSYIHEKYLSNTTFYKTCNIFNNPDQVITQDIPKFSEKVAELYASLAKPILDVIIYNIQLAKGVGTDQILTLTLITQLSSLLLRYSTPPFAKMISREQQLEGEYRYLHSRFIDFSEEIALWGGEAVEKLNLKTNYKSLIRQTYQICRSKLGYGILEDFVIKYFWSAAGYVLCSVPIFFTDSDSTDVGDRAKSFITNRRLLLSSSDAVGRLMYSYKEIAQLYGFGTRIHDLIHTLDIANIPDQSLELKIEIQGVRSNNPEIHISDHIEFDHVPIVTPNGEILLKELTFRINPGMHLLIIGPNGSGKSSLFRILGGLWPVVSGKLFKPEQKDLFYIPQRPYFTSGTLRDQIIYPDTITDFEQKQKTDQDLVEILGIVQLSHIISHGQSFDIKNDWKDVLAGGDKQRIAMARLFYHSPRFAILDECTSSVSMELEKILYEHAQKLGITLITVSHRTSVWKYHNWVLEFDGRGSYVFCELNVEERLKLHEEKNMIEMELDQMRKLEGRLEELQRMKIESKLPSPIISSGTIQRSVKSHANLHQLKSIPARPSSV